MQTVHATLFNHTERTIIQIFPTTYYKAISLFNLRTHSLFWNIFVLYSRLYVRRKIRKLCRVRIYLYLLLKCRWLRYAIENDGRFSCCYYFESNCLVFHWLQYIVNKCLRYGKKIISKMWIVKILPNQLINCDRFIFDYCLCEKYIDEIYQNNNCCTPNI